MKKSLIALAALSALSAMGVASAQSTVTLYGMADAYIASERINGLTQTVVNSGGQNGSRWGLRVNEDLGNGLSVIAVAESGFDISSGGSAQGGLLFGRQAFVGIKSAFGTVSLGRQYSPYDDIKGDLSLLASNDFDATNGPTGNNEGTFGAWKGYEYRVNNSVKYTSASFAGFSATALYGLGEDKAKAGPGTSASHTFGLAGSYRQGPLLVSLVHQEDGFVRAANNGRNQRENTLVGASYDFGVVKVGGGYNEYRVRVAGDKSPKAKEFFVGVSAPLGPVTLKGQYARSKVSGSRADDSFGIDAMYAFSKRTSAYVGFNTTKFANAAADGSDTKNRLFGLGLRHAF